MTTLRSMVRWFDPRRRLIAVFLAAWVVVVVTGAGERSRASARFGVPDLSGLVAATLSLSAVVGLVVLIVMRPRLGGGASSRRASSIRGLLLLTIVIVMLVLVFGDRDTSEEPEAEPAATPEVDVVSGDSETPTDKNGGATDSSDIVALILVAAVAAGVLVWSGSRPQPDPAGADIEVELPVVPDLAPAFGEATALLLHGRDPREAVLAAYASLERALTGRGHGRDPAETATEHLARVLADDPGLAAPAIELGALYELARFSDREITIDDQHRAAESLDRARHKLATPVHRSS